MSLVPEGAIVVHIGSGNYPSCEESVTLLKVSPTESTGINKIFAKKIVNTGSGSKIDATKPWNSIVDSLKTERKSF